MTTQMPFSDYTMPSARFHTFFPVLVSEEPDFEEITSAPPLVTYVSSEETPETSQFAEAITTIYQEATTAAINTAKDLGQEGSHAAEDDGASMIILIAVIVSTLLVFLCVVVVFRYTLKHKGSYYTREDKEANWTRSENAELQSSHSLDDVLDEGEGENYI